MSATGCSHAPSLRAAACAVLMETDPYAKAQAAESLLAGWRVGRFDTLMCDGDPQAPLRPGRLDKPELVPPGQVPRRRLGTQAGRAALLHAIAHIELNAIDLAIDMVVRFLAAPELDADARTAFAGDWVGVAGDEGRHFLMICERLDDLGARYGDLPAHDGLWHAAEGTAHDVAARLAVAPLVLEARGLDVTPGMIAKLRDVGDADSAERLHVIYTDEIGHVATGARWFRHVCAARGLTANQAFTALVSTYFTGILKPPFNVDARAQAGLPLEWYVGLAQPMKPGGEKA